MNPTKTLSRPFARVFLLLAFSSLSLSSCLKKQTEEPELKTAINVVNAVVSSPPLSFSLNEIKVQGPLLNYNEDSGYFITFPGNKAFGVSAESYGNMHQTTIQLIQNTYHTLFICGEAGSVSSLFTMDDLSTPPNGQAKIRFANLTSDSDAFSLVIKNGATLFTNQKYKTASPFITLAPGTYDIQLKTIEGAVLSEMNITLVSGRIYNAWSKGLKSGTNNSPVGLQLKLIN